MHRKPTLAELNNHYSDYPYVFPQSVRLSIEKSYEELLMQLEPYRKNNKLLDYGCGTGIFLQKAIEKGWQAIGIELSEKALIECRNKNLTVYTSIEELPSEKEAEFDVITMFEVIEHLSEVNETIDFLSSLLRINGVFYNTTPNFNNPARWLHKENYHIIEYPEHLLYFSCASFNNCLRLHGFSKKQISTTGIDISSKRKFFSDVTYSKSLTTNEIILVKSQKNVFLKFSKKTVNYFLSIFRLGMTIKALYIKNK